MRKLWSLLRDLPGRLPFTMTFMVAMAACTVVSGLSPGGLSTAVPRFGLSIDTLAQGEFWRIFTATLIAPDWLRLVEQLLLIAVMIGVFEALHGTRRSLVIFWGADIFGKLSMLGLFLGPLGSSLHFGIPNQTSIFDVGVSGGGMALLAGSLHRLFFNSRFLVLIVGLGLLGLKIIVWPQPDSDVLHLLAFPMGWALAEVARRQSHF